jgi:hypothetical protein
MGRLGHDIGQVFPLLPELQQKLGIAEKIVNHPR